MKKTKLLNLSSYAPARFLDRVEEQLRLKNDAALARSLEVTPALLSRIRNRRMPVSASLLLSIHELSQIAIPDLRQMMGDSRRLFS